MQTTTAFSWQRLLPAALATAYAPLVALIDAALAAVAPYRAVERHLHWRDATTLLVGAHPLALAPAQPLHLVAIGKAAWGMASAALAQVGDRPVHGCVVVKDAPASRLGPLRVVEADHPIPAARSLAAAKVVLDLVKGGPGQPPCTATSKVIVLLSGGASALVAQPVVALEHWQALHHALLRANRSIAEINAIRGPLDAIKHGGLARHLPQGTASLVISDVVGDPLDVIGSAPMGPTPAFDPLWIATQLRSLGSESQPWVQAILAKLAHERARAAVPAPGPISLCANNDEARQAAIATAAQLGYQTVDLGLFLQGEARSCGRKLAHTLQQSRQQVPTSVALVVVAGGETTVDVQGDGIGSRNQELAWACVQELATMQQQGAGFVRAWMMACVASDGDDGPTGAGGVVVDAQTWERAHRNIDVAAVLQANDCDRIFRELDQRLPSWQSPTNVGDLMIAWLPAADATIA